MNGRSIALAGLILLCISIAVQADRITFDAGSLDCGWTDEGTLILAVRLNGGAAENGTWVLTVLADRFDDGVFAWQLHVSETYRSVLVVPNDFLTARNFLPEALGIAVALGEGSLEVRIPEGGPIPNLIAPGDEVRLHALWLGSDPLVAFPVSGAEVGIAGGGGGVEEEVSSDPLPSGEVYPCGEPIRHSFILIDPDTGRPRLYVPVSYSLLRIREGKSDQFLRFAQIEQDQETGVFSYEIDTTRLAPGRYRLIIAVASEERFEKVLEIVASGE